MKRVILLCCLVTFVLQSKAQLRFHVGATTALNSTFVLDKGLKADPRYLSTGTYKWAPIGFNFGMDIGKKFGLNLEAIKAAQGQIYDVVDAYNQIVGQRNFDMEYLQFPLLLKFMSGGDGTARFNFQLGPQLSIIQTGTEILQYVQSVQNIPDGVPPPPGATLNPDGTYNVPEFDEIIMATNDIDVLNDVYNFRGREIQLAAAMGLDIDISRQIYLTTQIRANYSFTDMRGQELIDILRSGAVSEIFDQRANLAVGVQIGLHWMIGGTRRFNALDKRLRDEMSSDQ